MSLAEKLLSNRINKRKAEARLKYAEGSKLKQAQYGAIIEEQRLLAERVRIEHKESRIQHARAEIGHLIQRQSFEQKSDCNEADKMSGQEIHMPDEISWWRLLGRPWTYCWRIFLILSMILGVVLGVMTRENHDLAPLYASVMAGCIPLSICIFFAELSRRVGVKVGLLAAVFILGGVLSIVLTTFVNHCFPVLSMNPTFAGIVEEPCKGAVLLLIFVALPRFRGALAGLSFGAAVGAGFASIETFSYAYGFGTNGMPSTAVLILRGVLSPLMHTGWTAALGGSMWFVLHPCGEKKIAMRWCYSAIVLLAMIGCHCVWNSGSPVGYLPLIVWVIIFYYAKRGVQEINVFKKELV